MEFISTTLVSSLIQLLFSLKLSLLDFSPSSINWERRRIFSVLGCILVFFLSILHVIKNHLKEMKCGLDYGKASASYSSACYQKDVSSMTYHESKGPQLRLGLSQRWDSCSEGSHAYVPGFLWLSEVDSHGDAH